MIIYKRRKVLAFSRIVLGLNNGQNQYLESCTCQVLNTRTEKNILDRNKRKFSKKTIIWIFDRLDDILFFQLTFFKRTLLVLKQLEVISNLFLRICIQLQLSLILTIKTRLMCVCICIYKRASLASAARLSDTLCPREAPFGRLE